MLAFLLRRLGLLVPTFIGVTIAAFFFIRLLPGDPIMLLAGERGISPERYAELASRFGFDRPLYEQYFVYLGNLFSGDLGVSFSTKRPVLTEFMTLFPATLELSICAMLFAIVLGLPAGVIAAVRRGKAADHAVMTTALVGYSMPIFWWALLLIIVFSGWLQWTPVSGRISLLYFFPPVTGFMLIDSLISGQKGAFQSAVQHLILPTIVLGTIPLAVIARQTRSAMLEVLGDDYIRTPGPRGCRPSASSACMPCATH
ncbi:Dipeptide transport system permease protein DppB [Methylobrevis pamukkalensis]|uniref:Dipeptide transport system permease protein DppB n=1 Tax=Methylobrevis pamukkalensis TaxID=1439726 RepID=A0A1E3H0W4_9HYPH|nr:Dipeptide transport system permease protein DppB [Methylobrevis pamukkalensis]